MACFGTVAGAQSGPVLPKGGTFAAGMGAIGTASNGALNITQSSARGIIDWSSFSIGAGGRVLINNGAGATLNRVAGGELSHIDGLLKATGSVYLINPNGVIVGANGCISTGGTFAASTRDIANSAFMSGGAMMVAGTSSGDIINRGAILARAGDVLLIGRSVENSGSIRAPRGTASLVSANNVLLTTLSGPSGIYVAPDASASGNLTQTGQIEAAAAALKAAGGNIYTLAGNRTGLISATGTKTVKGEVWLSAPEGEVIAGGTIAAKNADGTGGSITAHGAYVTVGSGAHISAQGKSGGTVLIGTSAPGGVDLANSTTIADGASILAGGRNGGGQIETSGHAVSIGKAKIAAGKGGSWLVDPVDLTIDSSAASTIGATLDSGTNVLEETTATSANGAGVQSGGAGDINVAAPISWTGSGALTLSAFNNLNVNAPITGAGSFTGSAGGAVSVGANVSATNILMAAGGNLTLNSGISLAGANGVNLQTSGNFINNAGASALSGGTGNWLVYSTDPSADTTGGLTPNFLQYGANAGATPAGAGNGLLYSIAPSLSVALSGTVEKTYDGTTAATFNGANASVSGLINGDTAAVTGSYASKNAGTGIGVTASNITATHGGIPVYGYAGTNPSVSANIGQIDRANVTAAIAGNPTKTYNATTTATLNSSNYQLTGFVAGEGATVNQPSSVAYDSADAGARTISATFSPTNFVANGGTSLSNYNLPAGATGPGTINPAPLLISGVLATDKTYDRTTNDPLNTAAAALYGIIGTDNVTLDTAGATGTFSTANAGSNLTVTASGFTITGTKASNYALTQPQGLTASINPAWLTISGVSANSKVYDGTNTAALNTAGATLSGVIAGDSLTLGSGSATGTFSTSDVGSSLGVTASGFTVTGAGATNYRFNQPSGLTADITGKPLLVSITSNPTKRYNGDSSAIISGFSVTGLVAGQSVTIGQTSHANYDSADAGARTVTATLAVSDYTAGTGTKLSNYILPTSVTGSGTINQAPVTITLVGNPSKTYDGNANATVSNSNFLLSGFLTGQSASVTQTSGLYDSPNAGVRGVSVTLSRSDFSAGSGTNLLNYSFPTTVTGFGTITPAAIGGGIYASLTGNPTKTYDGNTTAWLVPSDFTLTGFVNGDNATVTKSTGQYASKNVGVQPITVSLAPGDFTPTGGTNLSNYTLPTVAYGQGTINQATLTASVIGNPTKVYNGTLTAKLLAGNISIAGLAPGEGIDIADGVPAAYDVKQAGSRTITATIPSTDITPQSGTLLSNYILPTSASGTGTITQAPLSILGISAQSKTYDTTTAATISGSSRLFGLIGGDDVNLSTAGVTANFATANAGNGLGVTATGYSVSGADAANYQLFQPTGLAANIYRKSLSITGLTAQNKNYDGTNAASLNLGSASLAGVLGSDSVALDSTNETASFSSVNAGNNLAVSAGGFALSGAQSANYSLTQPSGLTANILAAPLTALIIGNPTKVYDGSASTTLRASNYQLTGFAPGEGASVPQSAAATYVSPDAGTRGITSTLVSSDFLANSGTNLANYVLPTSGSGTGTITQAPLTAKIIGNPTKTYDATTAATLSSGNYSLSGFIGSQGATVTQTSGTYGAANAGSQSISALLSAGDFTANGGTNLNNYLLPTSAAGTGTINKATLQVIDVLATSRAYNGAYNDTLDVTNAAVSGLFGSDTVTLNTGSAAGLFASKNAGTNIGVTASGFTISGGQSANYNLAQPTGLAADITQAMLSLTKVARVYDSTTGLPGASSAYTLGGIFGADSVSVDASGISGNYADKNVGTAKSVTATGIALSGAQAGNYTIASSVTNANIGQITPAPLSVANVHALDKVYDATTAATLDNSSATLAGIFAGDDVTLNAAGSTGVFANKNAGTNKAVTATGYSVSGADTGNYTFTQPSGLTANITPYTGLTLTDITKIYDGTTGLPTITGAYTLAGKLGSDNVQVNAAGVTGSYAQKDVGSGLAVNLSGMALSGSDAANYSISSSLSNAPIGTITQKTLTASITGTPTKTYNATTAATLSPSDYSITGFVAGESASVTQTSGTYTSADAGSRGVSATLASGDFTANGATLLSNYVLPTSASGTGNITKAALTITGVLATNKAYDGTTADPLNKTAAALSGVFGPDTGLVTLNSASGTGTFASKNVGTGIPVTASGFTISGTKSGNYLLSQPTGLYADITQALLTLTKVNKQYDATTSAVGAGVTYTLGGVKGGDIVSLNTAGLSGSYADKNVATGIGVSMSGLSLTGAQASNYSIASSVTNALIGTITKAPLSVSGAVAVSKVYDGTAAAVINNSSAALSGVLGSDVVSLSSPSNGTFASSNAGTWTVTPGANYTISGADAGNYSLTQPSGFSATITRAPLSASIINNPTKTYDGSLAAILNSSNYLLTGFIGSQSATVNQTVGTYDLADAGSRTVTASLSAGNFTAGSGTSLSNYILPTSATGAGTINQKALTASIIGNPTKSYDQTLTTTLNPGNYSITGFVAGQGATVSQTAGSYDATHAGARTVSATLSAGDFTPTGAANLANYILPTTASGAGTINPIALSAAITGNPTKTYDASSSATLTPGNYTLTGFLAGEGATVNQAAGSYNSPDAGARTVTANLTPGNFSATGPTLLSDYVLPVSATGAGTINPKALTASISGNPTKTYDATTTATLNPGDYTINGFVGGQGATVNQTTGSYAGADAGSQAVSTTLAAGDFTANGGTNLANYTLPVSASGMGTINPKALAASIVGNPAKTYDGTTAAILSSTDYSLTGFVAGQGATVNQASGAYDSANAGARTVTATLAGTDFSANGGTNLANYILPASAAGAGTIHAKALAASISGNPTKTYDGTNAASLASADYTLSGFVAGESATVNQSLGIYDSADAGARTVNATLGAGDFTPGSGTLLSNYVLPASATGNGWINTKALTASITGNPAKIYDGTLNAALNPGDYTLYGFVAGQGASVNQAAGLYDSADAGSRNVSAALTAGDFTANGGTNLANYSLPASASGLGSISPKMLTASITGAPRKIYDGTTAATLNPGDYSLAGFVAGQGASVTQTAGSYDLADAGTRSVSATLAAVDFNPNAGTNLSNYSLPASATGAGVIDPKALTATITGSHDKTYDGTTAVTLAPGDYALTGFVGGEGASVTQTNGAYDSANSGPRNITATLANGDFSPGTGTNLANYVLPVSATGTGIINPKTLTAAITGTPTKAYDGTTVATLGSGNFVLNGFIAGEGATVTKTAGAYDASDAGARSVSASLGAADFAAAAGTLLSNYALPTTASGSGQIDPAALTVAIVNASKTYDGNNAAALQGGNFSIAGLASGESASITQTAGLYTSADAGTHSVAATLASGDFLFGSGVNSANYVLPVSASGTGWIRPKTLSASITGTPSKVYDGTVAALLGTGDYALDGFVAGQGATITQTAGAYSSANAGARIVTANLLAQDFLANAGTNLANYVLPVSATGLGTITRRALTASIVGTPTKMNDGSLLATLSSKNFALSGFVPGEGASVTQSTGAYDLTAAGPRTVSAMLAPQHFSTNAGTLLSNYALPASASGPGLITPAVQMNEPTLSAAIVSNMAVRDLAPASVIMQTAIQALFAAAVPRTYIPYPAPSALSTWQNNGFGSLPSIVLANTQNVTVEGTHHTVETGAPVINTTEQILLQGGKNKSWRIALPEGEGLAR